MEETSCGTVAALHVKSALLCKNSTCAWIESAAHVMLYTTALGKLSDQLMSSSRSNQRMARIKLHDCEASAIALASVDEHRYIRTLLAISRYRDRKSWKFYSSRNNSCYTQGNKVSIDRESLSATLAADRRYRPMLRVDNEDTRF
jgi:hypothetical protein